MALVEMVMPKMGESVMEGTILQWLKAVGEEIEEDEPVLEVATDKVDTEVPATHAGVLKEILAQEGDVVQVGQPIAIISTDGDAPAATPTAQPETAPATVAAIEQTITEAQTVTTSSNGSNGVQKLNTPAAGRFYSPLVLNIAKTEGISMQELEYVPGTGMDSRVTKKDILAYVAQRQSGNVATQAAPAPVVAETPAPQKTTAAPAAKVSTPAPVSYSGAHDIVEMDRMRKMIAQRMVESKRISPHVTTFVEADVTNIVMWRNKVKKEFQQRHGEKITFTPIFIEAIAKTLRDFPMVNSSVEGDNIIVKKDINIGMATALPSGNLIVPVIKNADQMNLLGLAKKVNDLANRARANKLTPDELSGGTYTMSNIGGFGNEMGTPILMQPQVGILAIGAIKKKPVVIETPQGDVIGIRHMMFMSHSYDHRIVDGALGGGFVRRVADYLEAFNMDTDI
ncbi:2-oxoglutarate dehydrogenase [marine bacterium AO1-C]|nr:2-oxoglutarate dehydrogenase [marine bacterium AO1-C]